MTEHELIAANNAAFQQRLRQINRSPEGQAALKALQDAQRWFREQYRQAALAHWKERGNSASTGWGCVPEGQYQESLKPSRCAVALAEKLAEYVGENPFDPPGKH